MRRVTTRSMVNTNRCFMYSNVLSRCFFFFQAEDGIRDLTVTGVQTCALPILRKYLLWYTGLWEVGNEGKHGVYSQHALEGFSCGRRADPVLDRLGHVGNFPDRDRKSVV